MRSGGFGRLGTQMLTLALFHETISNVATNLKYELEGDLGVGKHPQEFKDKRPYMTSCYLGEEKCIFLRHERKERISEQANE